MKTSSKILLAISVATALALFALNKKSTQKATTTADEVSAPSENVDPIQPAVTKSTTPVLKNSSEIETTQRKSDSPLAISEGFDDARGSLTRDEVQSVQNITKTISRAIAQKYNSTQFMKAVQDLKLKPKFIDEGSNSVGTMVTVRTHDALEGTRYLHAQFTGEKNNADFLQHISFQIRPGSDSFQKAVEILNEVLPKNKTIKEVSSDYILYNTEDGYVAWAKIATRDDLKSNKYNASAKEDVGSIIVTIEQEIHDMDDQNFSH